MYVKCHNDSVSMHVFKYTIKHAHPHLKIYEYICKRSLIHSHLKSSFKVHLLHDWFSGGILFDTVIALCSTSGPLHSWCVSENAVFTMYVVLE